MIDDEFEDFLELLLPVMLAKRRLLRVPERVHIPVSYPGGAKIIQVNAMLYVINESWIASICKTNSPCMHPSFSQF
jgi:hypothetical protein